MSDFEDIELGDLDETIVQGNEQTPWGSFPRSHYPFSQVPNERWLEILKQKIEKRWEDAKRESYFDRELIASPNEITLEKTHLVIKTLWGDIRDNHIKFAKEDIKATNKEYRKELKIR